MNARQLRLLDSIENALHVLGQPAFATPRISHLTRELEAVRLEILELKETQSREENRRIYESAKGDRIAPLRLVLRRDHVRPICREGRRLLKGMPGIRDSLRIPHMRETDEALLKATDRILKNAALHAQVFIDAGFHSDFIDRARRAAAAIVAKRAEPVMVTAIQRRSRATASIPDALSRGREIIASIDSMVETDLVGKSVPLDLWREAKKIPKKVGRPKKRRPPRG